MNSIPAGPNSFVQVNLPSKNIYCIYSEKFRVNKNLVNATFTGLNSISLGTKRVKGGGSRHYKLNIVSCNERQRKHDNNQI